jgi:hypothetical protein
MLLVLTAMNMHLLHQRLNLVNKKSQLLEPLLSRGLLELCEGEPGLMDLGIYN